MKVFLQIENINKEIKMNQMEILELKNITTEMKNSPKKLNIFELAEETVSILKGRSVKIKQSEEQRKKNKEK